MIWAIKNNVKLKATSKDRANCSLCNKEVIAKCGEIKIWHWAHKSNIDCDDWFEPESEWHLNWKDEFPKECQEVTIKKCVSDYCNEEKYTHNHNGEDHGDCMDCEEKIHRADIKINNQVIELQNSPLSSDKIIEREEFYGNMIWLLNGKKLCKGIRMKREKEVINFRWYHPPKSWWFAKKIIYIDFSDVQEEEGKWIPENDYMDYEGYYKHIADKMKREIFIVKKIYPDIPCGGWGIMISKKEFLNKFGDINGKRN